MGPWGLGGMIIGNAKFIGDLRLKFSRSSYSFLPAAALYSHEKKSTTLDK